MAPTDPTVVEMPADPALATMPTYALLGRWVRQELVGLTPDQLDWDDQRPDREWAWWSIRRQVSHMAWDVLVFSHRRCAGLLWPHGDVPAPVVWEHHHLGPGMKVDRYLDPEAHPTIDDNLAKLDIGLGWLARVVEENPIEALRATRATIRGTHFWRYAITVLPRGAAVDAADPTRITYDLEGSLWMVFYEVLTHVRTVQRLKEAQGLAACAALPRVGYLRLPEFWGDSDANGPSFDRL
jgi:hypothetical protein